MAGKAALAQSDGAARVLALVEWALAAPPELAQRLERLLEAAEQLVGGTLALVALRAGDDVEVAALRGAGALRIGERLPLGSGLVGTVVASGQPLRLQDLPADPRVWRRDLAHWEGTRAWLGVPLAEVRGTLGALCVASPLAGAFGEEQEHQLGRLATLLSAALREARLLGQHREELAERAQAEERLRQALEAREGQHRDAEQARIKLRSILDATSEAMVLLSPEGRILLMNRRFVEFFGPDLTQLLERRVQSVQPEVRRLLDTTGFDALLAALGDPERRFTQLISQRMPEQRELEMFSASVHGPDQELVGRLYVFRDVTREREVDRMKGEFVSLVSHELRAPLTSIQGYLDLVLDGEAGPLAAKQREFLGVAKSSADRVTLLVNDLLDISRIEAGKFELRRDVLDLSALLREVANVLLPQCMAKAQRLELELPETLPSLRADRNRIVQVATNLLSNAIKYTATGGTITLAAGEERSESAGAVWVEVRDGGIGMSPDEQAHLFTRFYRAPNPVVRATQGTGLGLVISRALVELHGGSIHVTSVPGRGSTFRFTLPLDDASSEPPPGKRLLLASADTTLADAIRRVLEHAGGHLLVAPGRAAALEQVQQGRPDLVALDLLLPDGEGLLLLNELARQEGAAGIPLVTLAPLASGAETPRWRVVEWLARPLQAAALLERVGQLLGQERRTVLLAGSGHTRAYVAARLREGKLTVLVAADVPAATRLASRDDVGLVVLDVRGDDPEGTALLQALGSEPETQALPVLLIAPELDGVDARPSVAATLGTTGALTHPQVAEQLGARLAIALAASARR